MKVFLLDTNIFSPFVDEQHHNHPEIKKFIGSLTPKQDHIYTSPVVIGEILYGYGVCFNPNDLRKAALLSNLRKYPVVDITKHTVHHYAQVRSALFRKYGAREIKRDVKTIKEKRPEELIYKSTGKSLGIQENDLWIVASALERNMTFVTSDKMNRLKEFVQKDLKLYLDWVTYYQPIST